jgi:hypothetical protein
MDTQTSLFPLLPPAEAKTVRAPELGVALAKLPALSIRQPWAWLIVHGGKNIENRNWQTHFRGWFLIHAGKGMTEEEYDDVGEYLCGVGLDEVAVRVPPMRELHRGGIVGMAKLGNCVRGHESPWFCGEWGFVLDEVEPLDFLPCKGALGFFRLPNTEATNAGGSNPHE